MLGLDFDRNNLREGGAFMYDSILQFIQDDIKEIEKNVREILDDTKDAADLSNDIHERVLKLGCRIVGEIYEQIDEEIFKSLVRKEKYYVEQKNMTRSLVDVMGTVSFKRRGYVQRMAGNISISWICLWGLMTIRR